MTDLRTLAVVGKNFGDEGKGMAADWLCAADGPAAAVRHNGGAQAGHTVDRPQGRFVFHQLSSGSFRGADTVWADTFLPDLYKLGEEMEAFHTLARFRPRVWALPETCTVTVDDVLINMALEASRGRRRHGSCGMGINEADMRNRAGWGLPMETVLGMTAASLARRLAEIRGGYGAARLRELGLDPARSGEYGELLSDPAVLRGAAEQMMANTDMVQLLEDPGRYMSACSRVVFEGGQGLLLDAENREYAPHVTASRTGLTNPSVLCRRWGLRLEAVLYVTRSYVTRHGAGPLPLACDPAELGSVGEDRTNRPNPWQGAMRYGRHPGPEAFCGPASDDAASCPFRPRAWLLITHLNETDGMVRMEGGDRMPGDPVFREVFERVYASASPLSGSIAPVPA